MTIPDERPADRPDTTRRRIAALVAAIVVLALSALALRQDVPPSVIPATAPPTAFSADRAVVHVRAIAERPHPTGSVDHERVEQYVMAQLAALGLQPARQTTTGVSTVYAMAGTVHNIVARIPGTSSGTRAVMLAAHYDGVPAGPAASDDAAGIATLLETVRALRAGPPLRNDVIVLCTDGEEDGLLGGAAFATEHPWMHDVGIVLNFEARGTGGRSIMFETSPGNAALMASFARSVPHPAASSLTYALYKTLPNDTDGSEFKRKGAQLLNFAFAKNVEWYHTPNDDVAHLDLRSLQDHGGSALALARTLGNAHLPLLSDHDVVYFNVFDHVFVYPEALAVSLALITVLAFVVLVIIGVRRGVLTGRGIAIGLLVPIVATATAWGAGLLLWHGISAAHRMLGGDPTWRPLYLWMLVLLTVAVTLAIYALARRWARASDLLASACVPWMIASVLISMKFVGASYLLLWPVVSALVALGAMIFWRDGQARRGRTQIVVVAGAVLPLLLLVPTIVDTHTLLGLVPALVPEYVILTVLTAGIVSGAFALIADGAPVAAPTFALASTLAVAAWGLGTVRDDADHPIIQNVLYELAPDSSRAVIALEGSERGNWARAITDDPTPVPGVFAATLGTQPRRLRAVPVSASALTAAPNFTVVSDTRTATTRDVVVAVRVGDARIVYFELPDVQPSAAFVNGHPISTTGYRRPRERGWELSFANPEGLVRLHFVLRDTMPVLLRATTERSGLPLDIGLSLPPRPVFVSPRQHGDRIIVTRTFQL